MQGLLPSASPELYEFNKVWIGSLIYGVGPGCYSELSGTSISVVAATIAGAMTMPIKARAIKRSCMVLISLQGLPATCAQIDDRLD